MTVVPPELRDYIKEERAKGVDQQLIVESLHSNGWEESTIAAAFSEIDSPDAASPDTTQTATQPGPGSSDQKQRPKRLFTMRLGSEDNVRGNDILSILFQLGFASIFLVNGIIALGKPSDFEGLLQAFPLAVSLGHIDWMITFAGVNDLMLGSLILLGKAREFVWVWAGLWLAMVSIIKLIYLF